MGRRRSLLPRPHKVNVQSAQSDRVIGKTRDTAGKVGCSYIRQSKVRMTADKPDKLRTKCWQICRDGGIHFIGLYFKSDLKVMMGEGDKLSVL